MIDISLIKAENEKIYQAIKNQYKVANDEANNYKDSIKKDKLKENTNKAILQARQLKTTFDRQIMDALAANKVEYEAGAAEKAKPVEWTKDNSSKLIYQELQRNNKLLTTNLILNNNDIPSLEEHLDKHITDAEVKNIINSFIKGKSSENQGDYKSITKKILQSNITPMDEINSLLGQARLNEATGDLVKTDTFGHYITQDFPQKDYFSTEKNNYF